MCTSLHGFLFFHCCNSEWATGDVGLGQEIPVWKAVALLRIPLAARLFLTGQAGICREEEKGWVMHLVIPLIRLLQPFKGREGESERHREPNTIFPRDELRLSIPGIATGLQTIPTLSCVCWETEWLQCVRLTGPVCPAKGERPMLPAHSSPWPGPASVPQPLSQTLGRLRRHCWATAENTLQKINRSGPKKSKYLTNLRKAKREDECQTWRRRERSGGDRDGWRWKEPSLYTVDHTLQGEMQLKWLGHNRQYMWSRLQLHLHQTKKILS